MREKFKITTIQIQFWMYFIVSPSYHWSMKFWKCQTTKRKNTLFAFKGIKYTIGAFKHALLNTFIVKLIGYSQQIKEESILDKWWRPSNCNICLILLIILRMHQNFTSHTIRNKTKNKLDVSIIFTNICKKQQQLWLKEWEFTWKHGHSTESTQWKKIHSIPLDREWRLDLGEGKESFCSPWWKTCSRTYWHGLQCRKSWYQSREYGWERNRTRTSKNNSS